MIDRCPECGSDYGFYEKRITEYEQLYNFKGEPFDANEVQGIKIGKRKYCANCYANITKYVKDIKNE